MAEMGSHLIILLLSARGLGLVLDPSHAIISSAGLAA